MMSDYENSHFVCFSSEKTWSSVYDLIVVVIWAPPSESYQTRYWF